MDAEFEAGKAWERCNLIDARIKELERKIVRELALLYFCAGGVAVLLFQAFVL